MPRKSGSKPPLSLVVPAKTGDPPPTTLKAPGRQAWNDILAAYDIDSGARLLFQELCEAIDRRAEISAAINRDGVVRYGRGGSVRAHPLIKEETALRGLISRLSNRLGLGLEPVGDVGQPGRVQSWLGPLR
jgi:hypothetical protein